MQTRPSLISFFTRRFGRFMATLYVFTVYLDPHQHGRHWKRHLFVLIEWRWWRKKTCFTPLTRIGLCLFSTWRGKVLLHCYVLWSDMNARMGSSWQKTRRCWPCVWLSRWRRSFVRPICMWYAILMELCCFFKVLFVFFVFLSLSLWEQQKIKTENMA